MDVWVKMSLREEVRMDMKELILTKEQDLMIPSRGGEKRRGTSTMIEVSTKKARTKMRVKIREERRNESYKKGIKDEENDQQSHSSFSRIELFHERSRK